MALLEINLEKPALLEEIADEEAGGSTFGLSSQSAKSRGRQRPSGGSPLRKLGMFGVILAVVAVARALRGRRSSTPESKGVKVPIKDGSSDQSGRSQQMRVLGMVLAVVGAVVAARRMQNGNRR